MRNGSANIAAAAILALAALYALRLGPAPTYPAFGDDNAVYLVSAKSLSSTGSYRLLNAPGEPFATFYPIGYPALLSTVFKVTPFGRASITLARAYSALACLGFCLLSYRLLRQYLPAISSALLTLLIGLCPITFLAAGEIMSDALFALLSLAGVMLMRRALAADGDRRPMLIAVAAGLTLGAAFLVRTIGFTLIAGVTLACLLQPRGRIGRWIAFLAGAAFVAAPWMLWSAAHRHAGTNGYLQELAADFTWRTPLNNARAIVGSIIPDQFFAPLDTRGAKALMLRLHIPWLVEAVLGLALAGSMLVGWLALLKKRDVLATCAACYLAIVIVWPWEPSRFLVPMLPLLAVMAVVGVRALAGGQPDRDTATSDGVMVVNAALAACVLGSLTLCAMRLGNVWRSGHFGGPEAAANWKDMKTAFQRIRDDTPADALVISSFPEATYLFTGERRCRRRSPRTLRPALPQRRLARLGSCSRPRAPT
jgi:4-amino-4-deoxy-L-arabinose transferase-like glycosyltransferase